MRATTTITKVKRPSTRDSVFSIVIPSWNNLPFLKLCIDSIRKNSAFHHQIIIHLNEGHDGSLEWIKQQADVDYVHSVENIGVCYALNSCRSLVQTSYLVFMNDDMYACPKWDQHLKDEIDRINDPYFFLSSTAIEPVFSSNCAIQKDYGQTIETFKESQLLNEFEALPKKDWFGATWPPNVVHIDVWDMVGGYSTEFSPGLYSDPDFSMKLWSMGVRLFKGVSKSRVYHFGSKSVNRVKKNAGYYAFIAKWGITSSTLAKYLHRGEPFNGDLGDSSIGFPVKFKNFLKRIVTLFKR